MIGPIQLLRLIQINGILLKHALNRRVVDKQFKLLYTLTYLNPWSWMPKQKSRGEAIRESLESLGPIFVKFGQLLSTRQDLLPPDVIAELSQLQDNVPPFSAAKATRAVERSFKQPILELFHSFDDHPLASASIAQVHRARLLSGEDVAVKIRRPNIERVIQHDIALLYTIAKLAEALFSQGRQLRATDMVTEFEHTILDELDFMCEAANASYLKRNFKDSKSVYIPKIYWDYCHNDVYTLEYVTGIQISDMKMLKEKGANFNALAETLVEIFFTEAFDDNFFHADMHPGNILVDVSNPNQPVYRLVDFGIMGSLSESDQHYLAHNLLAFIDRDYRKVAVLHIESGWVPANTRVDQFETAFRTVCEPVFERPQKDISFGHILLRLIQTAERFNMQVQPQLLLLQKTLLNVESLARQLDPHLDLWQCAKPFLENYVKKQTAFFPLAKDVLENIPDALRALSKSPALSYELLQRCHMHPTQTASTHIKRTKNHSQKRGFFFGAASAFLIIGGASLLHNHAPNWLHHAAIGTFITAAILASIGWCCRR